jgi:hypothetical protein
MADAILGNFAISKKVAPFFEFFSKCCYIIYAREHEQLRYQKISRYGREQYSRDSAQGRTADAS